MRPYINSINIESLKEEIVKSNGLSFEQLPVDVLRIALLIHKHYNWDGCTIEWLKDETRTDVTRRFKGVTGYRPKEYINILRMELTRRLIQDSKVTNLSQIAYASGFYDYTSFSKAVKNYFGKSPANLRNELVKTDT